MLIIIAICYCCQESFSLSQKKLRKWTEQKGIQMWIKKIAKKIKRYLMKTKEKLNDFKLLILNLVGSKKYKKYTKER